MATAGDISVHLGIAHSAFNEGLRASRAAVKRFSRDLHTDIGESAQKQQRELSRVRNLIERVTARYAESGRDGGKALDILVREESRLVNAINARKTMVDRARLSWQQEQKDIAERISQSNILQMALEEEAEKTLRVAAARGQASGMGLGGRGGRGMGGADGARMLGTGLAFGLSDAFSAGMYGGFRGAALGAANNLPMVGEGIAAVSAKAAKGTSVFAGLAGVLARFAGPAGLVASVALPFAAALAPALLTAESAADKFKRQAEEVEAALARIKKAREEQERIESLRKDESELGGQKDRVKTLQGELSDLQKLRDELAIEVSHASRVAGNDGLWGLVNGAGGNLEEARAKMQAVEQQMREKSRELERQSAIEAEGEAAKARRDAWNKKYADIKKEADARVYWQGRAIEKERMEREKAREQERFVRGQEESAMQLSAERSLLGRYGMLQRQRREVMQQPLSSANLATSTDRNNSVERIAQMIANSRVRAEESRRDSQLEELEYQTRVLEKMYEALRGGDEGPALSSVGLR